MTVELHELKNAMKESMGRGDYKSAIEKGSSALMTEDASLSYDIDIADLHELIALCCNRMDMHEDALNHLFSALEIYENIPSLDNRNIYIAGSYKNIGLASFALHRYRQALNFLLKFRIAIETQLEKNKVEFPETSPTDMSKENYNGDGSKSAFHQDMANMLHTIGSIYEIFEEYSLALSFHLDALEIRELILIPWHPDIASSLRSIGTIYCRLGDFNEALKYHKKAFELRKAMVISPYHLDIARSYNALASIYNNLGDFGEAFRWYRAVAELHRDSFNRKNRLINKTEGDVKYHTTLFKGYNDRTIKRITEDDLIRDLAPVLAETYNGVGVVFSNLKEYGRAYNATLDALKAYEKASMLEKNLTVAVLYSNMGKYLSYLGEYDKAIDFFERALAVRMDILPKEHPDIARSVMNIGQVFYDMGMRMETRQYAFVLVELLPALFQSTMSESSNTFRAKILDTLRCLHDFIYSAVYIDEAAFPFPEESFLYYNILLQTKDINTEAQMIMRAFKLPERYPDCEKILSEIEDKNLLRSNLILNSPEKKEELARIENEILTLEISIAERVKEIDFKHHMMKMTAESILEKIPKRSALLEFGWFNYTKPTADERVLSTIMGTSGMNIKFHYHESIKNNDYGGRYYAYLLHREHGVILKFLDAPENVIHKELYNAREKIAVQSNTSEELSRLYEFLIAPFIDNLEGVEHLFIAPDGELYKLPFEVLIDKNGVPLSNKFKKGISYLSSGRDLVRLKNWNKPANKYANAAIIAEPMYSIENGNTSGTNISDMKHSQSKDIGDKEYKPLAAAGIEASVFKKTFTDVGRHIVEKYQLEATKYAFSQIETPDIIHVVTHGFFLEEQVLPQNRTESFFEGKLMHAFAEDPLIRSGLAFAGINNWLRSEKHEPLEGYGDGILNAKEVLALNMPETDLLVLSACQTGLGEARNGKGIQGLRRAFELAGVRSLICTLWSIDDYASAILMSKFYENILKNKMDKLGALTAAKMYVRDITAEQIKEFLRNNDCAEQETKFIEKHPNMFEDDKPYSNLYYWAGYILQGDLS